MRKIFTIISFLILSLQVGKSQCIQDATGDKGLVKTYLSYFQYNCALKELIILDHKKPKDADIKFDIAECYLNMDGDKSRAIKPLEFVTSQKKYNDISLLMLGKAYHYGEQFDKAIRTLNKYLATNPNNENTFIATQFIEFANNAKELIKFPVKVTFENLGEDVNSEWNDYTPYISPDEDYIIFSSNRDKTMGGYPYLDGFTPDAMIAPYRGKDFSRSKGMGGSYNTIDIDEVAGGSADGSILFITTDAEFQIFNLKISEKGPRSRSFPRPEYIEEINGKNSNEISATINNEGNLLIFSSDRDGGYGGYDLWLSKKLPTGKWGTPINLGPEINTKLDEAFPQFKHDQKTITFSSNGHYSMGEYDIFETTFSEELKTWTFPKNLGYPINTTQNDLGIAYTPTGRYAYKSAVRKDTYGMTDLYRITFEDEIPLYTVVSGKILQNDTIIQNTKIIDSLYTQMSKKLDSLKENMPDDSVLISSTQNSLEELLNKKSKINPFIADIKALNGINSIYGEYKINPATGNFIMILEPGIYEINIEHPLYKNIAQKINIYDKKGFTPFINIEFTLRE